MGYSPGKLDSGEALAQLGVLEQAITLFHASLERASYVHPTVHAAAGVALTMAFKLLRMAVKDGR